MDLDAVWANFIDWCAANDVIIPRGVCISNRHTTSRSPSVKQRPSRKETFGVYQVITKTFCDKSTQTDDFLSRPVKSEPREPPIIGVSEDNQKPELSNTEAALSITSSAPCDDVSSNPPWLLSSPDDDKASAEVGYHGNVIPDADTGDIVEGIIDRLASPADSDSDGAEPFQPLDADYNNEEEPLPQEQNMLSSASVPARSSDDTVQNATTPAESSTERVVPTLDSVSGPSPEDESSQIPGPVSSNGDALHAATSGLTGHNGNPYPSGTTNPTGTSAPERDHVTIKSDPAQSTKPEAPVYKPSVKSKEIFIEAEDLELPYPCPKCDARFLIRSRVKHHYIMYHTDVYPVVCEMCNFTCKTAKHLRDHKNRKCYGIMRYMRCERCNWSTSKSGKMKEHQSAPCEVVCDGKTFEEVFKAGLEEFESLVPLKPVIRKRNSCYRKIVITGGTVENGDDSLAGDNVHNGKHDTADSSEESNRKESTAELAEQEKSAPQESASLTLTNMSQGMETHKVDTTERTLQCHFCNKAMKLPRHLREHVINVHAPVFRYTCDGCGFTSRAFKNLTSHKKRTCEVYKKKLSNITRFVACERCNFSTRNENELSQHKKELCPYTEDDTRSLAEKFEEFNISFKAMCLGNLKKIPTETKQVQPPLSDVSETEDCDEKTANIRDNTKQNDQESDHEPVEQNDDKNSENVLNKPSTSKSSQDPQESDNKHTEPDVVNVKNEEQPEQENSTLESANLSLTFISHGKDTNKVDWSEPGRTYRCQLCHKSYKLPGHLREHMIGTHSPVFRYTCDCCGFTSKIYKNLTAHKRRFCDARKKSRIKRYTACDRCNYSSRTKDEMTQHKKQQCPYSEDDTRSLAEKFEEFILSLKAKFPESLKTTHTITRKVKPSNFDVSETSYSKKRKMSQDSEESEDDETEPSRYSKKRKLPKRKDNGPVDCAKCSKHLESRHALEEHYFSAHLPLYPYTCTNCDLTFKVLRFKRQHVILKRCSKIHTNYRCVRCNRSFRRKAQLAAHLDESCAYAADDNRNIAEKLRAALDEYTESYPEEKQTMDNFMIYYKSLEDAGQCKTPAATAKIRQEDLSKSPSVAKEERRKRAVCTVTKQQDVTSKARATKARHLLTKAKNGRAMKAKAEVRSTKPRTVALYPEMMVSVRDKRLVHVCVACDMSWSLRRHLRDHYHQHHMDVYMYHCPRCKAAFHSPSQMKKHISDECARSRIHQYKCGRCLETFVLESWLTAHQSVPCTTNDTPPGERTVHQSDPCITNDTPPGERYKNYMDHFEATVPKVRVIPKDKATKLGIKTASASERGVDLQDDLHTSDAGDGAEVTQEAEGQPSRKVKKRRWPVYMGQHSRPCPTCNKTLHTWYTWVNHRDVLHAGKSQVCHVCGKAFKMRSTLRSHMLTKHTENRERVTCDQCGASFSSRGSLRTHMRYHTGDGLRMCEICGKRVTSSSALESHMSWHRGERKHACVKCGARFTNPTSLKRHMNIHTGIYGYTCEYCGKKLREIGHYNNHIRTHTGDKPFSCSYCDYRCNVRHNLTKHVKTVHKF